MNVEIGTMAAQFENICYLFRIFDFVSLQGVSTPRGVYGAEATKKCAKIFLVAEYEFLSEFETKF